MTMQSPAHVAFSPRRVGAMVLRHWYLLSSSWPRVLDLIYWPAVQMLMWGFLQQYVSQNSGFFMKAAGTFIGAVMLWDILFRGQLGFSISFLEEMYARNLGNLMMSPLRPAEFVAALMIQSVIRLSIGMVPVSLLAIAFFGFNLWGLGLALAVFFLNLLLTSWAIGILVAGILLRHGLGAENMAWSFMFLFLPLTCVYYPVEVLPSWLQVFAWMLPPTYVFEGMRALIIEHVFRADLMIAGLRAQRRAVRRRGDRLPAVSQKRPPRRALCCRAAIESGSASATVDCRKTLRFRGGNGSPRPIIYVDDVIVSSLCCSAARGPGAQKAWQSANSAGRQPLSENSAARPLLAVRRSRTAFIGCTRRATRRCSRRARSPTSPALLQESAQSARAHHLRQEPWRPPPNCSSARPAATPSRSGASIPS